jgi:beta-1,4-N-acetylglucosaminyltransferase
MIFVTIGVMYGFERLVTRMDEIAGKISESVVMQIGETVYQPKYAKYFKYTSRDEMEDLYRNARVIVGHAGIGTITKALEHKKTVILVPRMKKYNELINDHQLEIAKELEKEGTATIVYNIEDLESALKTVHANDTYQVENTLVKSLKKYLDQISLGKKI